MTQEPEDLQRLDSFTKDEWWDVFKMFQPDATWEEYEVEWEKFQEYKAEHNRKSALN